MKEAEPLWGAPLPRRPLSSLGYRDFRLLLLSLGGAWVGFFLQMVAQGWLVLRLTDSPFWVGLVSSANALPFLFFSLPGGVVADRVNRRQLLTFTRGGMALSLLALAILTSADWVNRWHLLSLALFSGTLTAFDMPARQALIPELVAKEDLANAIALNSAVFNVSQVVGPAAAAVVVGVFGEAAGFYVGVAGNVGVVLALLVIRPRPERPQDVNQHPARDLVDGLKYLRDRPPLQAILFLAAASSAISGALYALMPVFARDVLGEGREALGILMTAMGLGAVAGAFLMAALGNFRGKGLALLTSSGLYSLAQMGFAASSLYALSLLALVVLGIASAFQIAVIQAALLLLAAPSFHGRIMSVYMLTWGFSSLSGLVFGALAEVWGPQAVVFAAGAAGVLFTAGLALTQPSLRRV